LIIRNDQLIECGNVIGSWTVLGDDECGLVWRFLQLPIGSSDCAKD
jgi:hypothetical protein